MKWTKPTVEAHQGRAEFLVENMLVSAKTAQMIAVAYHRMGYGIPEMRVIRVPMIRPP